MIVTVGNTNQELVCIDNKLYYKNIRCKCGCKELIKFAKYHIKNGEMPEFTSPSHLFKYLNNGKTSRSVKEKLINENKVLIKGSVFEIESKNGEIVYKDVLCACGCGKNIPYLKTHTHNGVPSVIHHHHINKPQSRKELIKDYNLIELNGELYYDKILCLCGCGNRIKFSEQHKYSGNPKFIKGHEAKTLQAKIRARKCLNSIESRNKQKENAQNKKKAKLDSERELNFIEIKGIKYNTEIINGEVCYSDKICVCGCGEKIPYRKRHRECGIPRFIQSHASRQEGGILYINNIPYYKDKFCNCGCGNLIPVSQGTSSLLIDGHKKIKIKDVVDTTIIIDGIKFYENRFCACGCGSRIKYDKRHKYFGISKYLKAHMFNDKVLMTKIKEESRERAIKQLSQSGSYGQTGTCHSEKNGIVVPYDSSYERAAISILEKDDSVISYDRNKIPIPYVLDEINRVYYPDFIVNYADSKVILEIKPKKFIKTEKNLAKFSACTEYCKLNDMKFIVWTEKDLGI